MTFLTDEVSGSEISITGDGPTASTDVYKFGGSAQFGSNKGAYQSNSPAKLYGASSFTISMWLKSSHMQDNSVFYSFLRYTSSSNWATHTYSLHKYNHDIQFIGYPGGFLSNLSDSYFSTSEWNHLAVVRDGNDWGIYVNGTRRVSRSSYSYDFNSATRDLYIGYDPRYVGQREFPGYIDDLHITNEALWTGSSFTVPTSPAEKSANSKILLPFDSATYHISGNVTQPTRIIVVDESDWSVEATEEATSSYDIEVANAGARLVISRRISTGGGKAYGNVTPETR
jgi:hypothetical protein